MEQNKMSPLPWEIVGNNVESKDMSLIYIGESDLPPDEDKANAHAIVTAVNNTYGAGINPEAVPDLLKVLTALWDDSCKGGIHRNLILESAKAAIEKATIK